MKLNIFSTLLLICLTSFAFGQEGKITGKVRDDKGESLIGATIIYKKDVTIGAVTDEKGNFMLEVPAGKANLICRAS